MINYLIREDLQLLSTNELVECYEKTFGQPYHGYRPTKRVEVTWNNMQKYPDARLQVDGIDIYLEIV